MSRPATGAVVRHLDSRANPQLVRLRKLAHDPLAYRKGAEVWLEGEHLCAAYAARGLAVAHAVVSQTAWSRPGLRELASHAATVAVVPDALMASLSALGSAAPLAFAVAWAGVGTPLVSAPSVVLDRVQDAGNVGTILRSAAAFGFTQVLALRGTAGLWSPKVLRAAMGAHFGLNLVETLDPPALAALRLPLFGASPHALQVLHQTPLPWPCAWVFGHEGQGVAAAIEPYCRQTLRIAQPGGEESLNVAAAAAICLYETRRQQHRACA